MVFQRGGNFCLNLGLQHSNVSLAIAVVASRLLNPPCHLVLYMAVDTFMYTLFSYTTIYSTRTQETWLVDPTWYKYKQTLL